MSELIFRPDASPAVTCLDGWFIGGGGGETTWDAVRLGLLGDVISDDSNNTTQLTIKSDSLPGKWAWLSRGVAGFDTSPLPSGARVISATLSLYGASKGDDLGITPDVNVYSVTLTDNINLIGSDAQRLTDFQAFGSTPFSTAIPYGDWDANGWNDFILNTNGINYISKIGITNFGIRTAHYDAAGNTPAWIADEEAFLTWWESDYTDGSFGPKLMIIYNSGQESVDKTIIGNKVSLEAIRNLEIVYGGRAYIGKSGNFVYESRYHRNV